MAARIPVPADAVRTREQVLADVTVAGGYAWVTCGHCGGSGLYPSSCLPPGRCNRYCWRDRTPETMGKLPVEVDKFVKREQARDRREYRARVEWERNAPMRAQARANELAAAEQDAYAEDERRQQVAAMRHVGVVGERVTIHATVDRVIGYDSQFGRRYIVGLRDDAGNKLAWFTGSPTMAEGDVGTLTATVKEHGQYNGEPQTTLLRAKLTPDQVAAGAA